MQLSVGPGSSRRVINRVLILHFRYRDFQGGANLGDLLAQGTQSHLISPAAREYEEHC